METRAAAKRNLEDKKRKQTQWIPRVEIPRCEICGDQTLITGSCDECARNICFGKCKLWHSSGTVCEEDWGSGGQCDTVNHLCLDCAKRTGYWETCSDCRKMVGPLQPCGICSRPACSKFLPTCAFCQIHTENDVGGEDDRQPWWFSIEGEGYLPNEGSTSLSRCCLHTPYVAPCCLKTKSGADEVVCPSHSRVCATCPTRIGCVDCISTEKQWRMARFRQCSGCDDSVRSALSVSFPRDLVGVLFSALFVKK